MALRAWRMTGIDAAKRSREDCLPIPLLTTIEKWLADCGAEDLAKWSHAYLAHAGGPHSRAKIAALQVTANKITDALKALARVTEAISAYLLFAGGRSGSLMPVAQFNPFEKLDKPIMKAEGEADAYKFWHQLSDERNCYLDGVDAELIQRLRYRRLRGKKVQFPAFSRITRNVRWRKGCPPDIRPSLSMTVLSVIK